MTASEIEPGMTFESTNRGHRHTRARVTRVTTHMVFFTSVTKRDLSHRDEVFKVRRDVFLMKYRPMM
ncbi:MAG: hypothetical protein ACR2J8_04255 [Thermomicrobiales bacterium]